ncbi:MAG TPA: methylated-DNA--[protein]-cysteine S-methyltransferase [Opitutus sp.]|nr:methylated-DNA--[protein]-cysteine S-methyltransferase [Opitutus sp.]
MNLSHDLIPIPLGVFAVAFDGSGAIHASAFGDLAALQSRLGDGHAMAVRAPHAGARRQLAAYFAGERRDFDLPLAPAGSPFQLRVWSALREIPCGETRSYANLAAVLRSSPRAVGRANATNPICLFIPCHRVIGADGALTGYAFGTDLKRRLLEHETASGRRAA